jgi:hypothetical protein
MRWKNTLMLIPSLHTGKVSAGFCWDSDKPQKEDLEAWYARQNFKHQIPWILEFSYSYIFLMLYVLEQDWIPHRLKHISAMHSTWGFITILY